MQSNFKCYCSTYCYSVYVYYFKLSYFSSTLILAIFLRQGFSLFYFSDFTENC